MAKKLTRVDVVGLELTREEVIDLTSKIDAVARKAQCREVNCDIIDMLTHVSSELSAIDDAITDILEDY